MRDAPSNELGYIQSYDRNNADQTLGGSFLQKSHYLLEKTLPVTPFLKKIIEVGSGTGHHFPFVKKGFLQYFMTDGSLEMLEIAKEKYEKEKLSGVVQIEQQDATQLSYATASFDRLIATHVLEHLPNPVQVLKEWNRVVKPGGIISIVLPCDPGFLWRFGRHLGPRRNAMKAGLAYDYLEAAEHINSIFNLVVFIRHHFELVTESWYPAKVALPDLNLFYICHIQTARDNNHV